MENIDEFQEDNTLPLGRIFNNSAAKVLDFLLLNRKFDYSESDITRLAQVPPRTLQRILPTLLDEDLLTRTRKSGKAYMYEANLKSERTLALQQYVKSTINENLEKLQLNKKIVG